MLYIVKDKTTLLSVQKFEYSLLFQLLFIFSIIIIAEGLIFATLKYKGNIMELSMILLLCACVCVVGAVAFVLDEHWEERYGSNHF